MKRLIPIVFALVACVATSVRAHDAKRLEASTFMRKSQLPDLRVSYQTLAPHTMTHGAPVVTLTVTNERPERRRLTVMVAHAGSVRRTLVVEPSASVTADFVGPVVSHQSCHDQGLVYVTEAGSSVGSLRVGYIDCYLRRQDDKLNVLIGPAIDGISTVAAYSHADEEAGKAKTGKTLAGEFYFYTQALGPAGWSADTRAYSGYDLVLLTAAEWAGLPGGARRALVGYAAQGGSLVLCGESELPIEARGFPAGAVTVAVDADRVRAVGRGCIVLAPAPGADRRPPLTRNDLVRLGRATRTALQKSYVENTDLGPTLGELPSLDLPSVPVSLVMLLLAVFALGVVPTVLFFCVRRQKRLAALVVLPLVSAAIGVVVVLGMLGVYGVTPHLNQVSTVLLNADDRRAAVFTKACVFAPTDVTDRLRFAREAHVVTVGARKSDYRWCSTDRDGNLCLEPGDTLSARGRDWLETLKPVVYATSALCDTPARLAVEELAADRLKVTNLLGAPVTELTVADSKGRLFAGKGIADGATCELTPGGDRAVFDALGATNVSVRACYRADLSACPFLPDLLGGTPAKRTSQTTVFGRYGKEVSE